MLSAIDEAYYERNQLVAALARLFPSGLRKTDIDEWDPAWHNCVFIDLPTGQVSWHFHDREAHLFEGLPAYERPWDGHSTQEKYKRVANLRYAKGYYFLNVPIPDEPCTSLTTPDPDCPKHGARR